MKFSQFGAENGRLVIYFHGAPGAPEECRIFDQEGKKHGLSFICFDRFSIDSTISQAAYFRLLAAEISRLAAGKPVDMIGFSMGAFIALQTSRQLGNGVRSLHLVSAAAPLEAGDFLDAMAAKPIFRLANASPALFMLLSYWQGLLAWLAPNVLFHLFFSSATGEDKALAADISFRAAIIKIMKWCYLGRIPGYARDINDYLQPWKDTLAEVTVATHIWQGEVDNWTPKPMADYLHSAIPGSDSIKIYPDASHYSCLYRAAPEICTLVSS